MKPCLGTEIFDFCRWRGQNLDIRENVWCIYLVNETAFYKYRYVYPCLDPHTVQQKAKVNHCCTFFSSSSFFFFNLLFYLENCDRTVQNEIWNSVDRWDFQVGKHAVTGKDKRTYMNSIVTNDMARPKPKGRLGADVHKGKTKAWCYIKHTTGTWKGRSMNQGQMKIVKQAMECLNIAVIGFSKLKWTGIGHFQTGNYKVFYSRNDKLRRNEVALILRQDIIQTVKATIQVLIK